MPTTLLATTPATARTAILLSVDPKTEAEDVEDEDEFEDWDDEFDDDDELDDELEDDNWEEEMGEDE
ncbi:MAG: hypothetical protein PVSMB4_11170 [Ktedonobacterales bacterium]